MSQKEHTKLVPNQYRVFCQEGKDLLDVMKVAQCEWKLDKYENSSHSAGSKIAAIFGMK